MQVNTRPAMLLLQLVKGRFYQFIHFTYSSYIPIHLTLRTAHIFSLTLIHARRTSTRHAHPTIRSLVQQQASRWREGWSSADESTFMPPTHKPCLCHQSTLIGQRWQMQSFQEVIVKQSKMQLLLKNDTNV